MILVTEEKPEAEKLSDFPTITLIQLAEHGFKMISCSSLDFFYTTKERAWHDVTFFTFGVRVVPTRGLK